MHARQHSRQMTAGTFQASSQLEDRTVPSGNVQVAVIGHTLDIAGDSSTMQVIRR